MEVNKYIVKAEEVGLRLDKYLQIYLTDRSRSKIGELIDDEKVKVNGFYEKSSYKTKLNDEIEVEDQLDLDTTALPEDIPLDIVYEDDDVIVINKPYGMVVHPANGHYSGTLVNALLFHFGKLSDVNGDNRPGIVHRLDKDTSGLIMVAKNNAAHIALADQLKDKTANRVYDAVVCGQFPQDNVIIEGAIGRNHSNRKKMAVISEGKDARTHVHVNKRYTDYTYITCVLETGRTHQIRVHLSTLRYPIAGDELYGYKNKVYDHMLLHAKQLTFVHPTTHQKMTFYAPLPSYFEQALKNLDETGKISKEN